MYICHLHFAVFVSLFSGAACADVYSVTVCSTKMLCFCRHINFLGAWERPEC
jgi:hypothetical protein